MAADGNANVITGNHAAFVNFLWKSTYVQEASTNSSLSYYQFCKPRIRLPITVDIVEQIKSIHLRTISWVSCCIYSLPQFSP